jgi:hypothetical protein
MRQPTKYRRIILSTLCLAGGGLAACSGGDVATEPWVPVSAAGYSLEMPAEPEQETFEAPSAVGPIAVDTWLVEEGDSAVAFAVSEMPEESLAGGPDPVLQNAVAGAASNIGGTTLSDEAVEGLDYPARDAEISTTSEGAEVLVFLRAILIEDQLIQMQSLGPAENRDDIEATFDRLVESFSVDG